MVGVTRWHCDFVRRTTEWACCVDADRCSGSAVGCAHVDGIQKPLDRAISRNASRTEQRGLRIRRISSTIHRGCRAGDRVGGKPQRLAPQRRQRAVWICRGLCLADQVGTERGADGVGAAGRQQTAGLPHRGTGHRDAHGAHGVVPFGLGSEFAAPAWPAAGACCCCSCCCMSCCCCSLCSLTPAFSRMVCARAISASRSS